jgi:hypothetical protein
MIPGACEVPIMVNVFPAPSQKKSLLAEFNEITDLTQEIPLPVAP